MFAVKSCKAVVAALMLLQVAIAATAHDYRKVFDRDYQKAETSAGALRPLLTRYATACGEDANLMEAVIFPELMRYNVVFDAVETGSLMSLYTRLGSDYANFSIGRLQMKPSFATSIEKYLLNLPNQQWVNTLGFDKIDIADTYDSRVARISRLDNPEGQIKYLVAMLKCIKIKHSAVWYKLSARQKLLFVASAYNCGWDKSATTIHAFCKKRFYKLRPWSYGAKYCFAEIALQRYNELQRSA